MGLVLLISEISMTRNPLQCPPVLGSCTPKWLPIYAHIRLFDNYQMKWPNVISPSDLGIGRSILVLRWFCGDTTLAIKLVLLLPIIKDQAGVEYIIFFFLLGTYIYM